PPFRSFQPAKLWEILLLRSRLRPRWAVAEAIDRDLRSDESEGVIPECHRPATTPGRRHRPPEGSGPGVADLGPQRPVHRNVARLDRGRLRHDIRHAPGSSQAFELGT